MDISLDMRETKRIGLNVEASIFYLSEDINFVLVGG